MTCTDSTPGTPAVRSTSHFTNAPFTIDDYIPPTDTTCPSPARVRRRPNGMPQRQAASPGGCTRDLVHRFYQEQYQLDGGTQDRYVTGSDAIGLTMGYYDTKALPIYQYLHAKGASRVRDRRTTSSSRAFGGSFLNHQWLIAAATPVWAGALDDGSATTCTPCSTRTGCRTTTRSMRRPLGADVKDQQLTQSCSPAATPAAAPAAFVCGNYAVNTTQPFYQPYSPGTA